MEISECQKGIKTDDGASRYIPDRPLDDICSQYTELVNFSKGFYPLSESLLIDDCSTISQLSKIVFRELGYLNLLRAHILTKFQEPSFDERFTIIFDAFVNSLNDGGTILGPPLVIASIENSFFYSLFSEENNSRIVTEVDAVIRIFLKIIFDQLKDYTVEDFSITPADPWPLCDQRKYINGSVAEARSKIAKQLVAEFGEDMCRKTPGLIIKGDGTKSYWSLSGSLGLLIPVRDDGGLIIGYKIRSDSQDGNDRYSYLSSRKYGGPSPGALVHIPLYQNEKSNLVRITEGELKADVATVLSKTLTLSVPGATNWKPVIPVIKKMKIDNVSVAFDQDMWTNHRIALPRALLNALC